MIAKNDFAKEDLLEFASGCERAISRAIRKTLIEHKLLGEPIVVDEGNGPHWIPADEIEIPAADEETVGDS